ncbi:hypothetical protein TUM19329_30380 [Legionella antarctica]|uniref:F-box domain-containing protein n=2 Tax=Legionella antarctica TaxID=2708020 RepID=A0A6F8T983_9GAMM|nr:hypothetical protein TUM19329_30380 [Legionella antarctica]
MQEKFDFFYRLPDGIKSEVTRFLPTKDFINLTMSSQSNYQLFKTSQQLKPLYKARKFLHYVVRGNHEAVATMLEMDPGLMSIRGQVCDLSGRTFTDTSGFEYCMWALDKHMWKTMLDSLAKTIEGEQIKDVLQTQYQKIKKHGLTYILLDITKHSMPETITEKHFDFEGTIIKQLQESVDIGADNQWRTGVGGAQRLLPSHVVDEYCSDTFFYPVPDFKVQFTSQKDFLNWLTGKKESWFSPVSKLGEDFAIFKGSQGFRGLRGVAACCKFASAIDLNAIVALYKVRTSDFLALEDNLKPCNLSENQYHYGSIHKTV